MPSLSLSSCAQSKYAALFLPLTALSRPLAFGPANSTAISSAFSQLRAGQRAAKASPQKHEPEIPRNLRATCQKLSRCILLYSRLVPDSFVISFQSATFRSDAVFQVFMAIHAEMYLPS
jgi:hypothetical protein